MGIYIYICACLYVCVDMRLCIPVYVGDICCLWYRLIDYKISVISSKIPGEKTIKKFFSKSLHSAHLTRNCLSLDTCTFYRVCGNFARTSSEKSHRKIFHRSSQRSCVFSSFSNTRGQLWLFFSVFGAVVSLACGIFCFLFKVGQCPLSSGLLPCVGCFSSMALQLRIFQIFIQQFPFLDLFLFNSQAKYLIVSSYPQAYIYIIYIHTRKYVRLSST